MIFEYSQNAVGPLTKGMQRGDVRRALGQTPEEFRKSANSVNTTDDFGPLNLHAYYDANNVLIGIEVFNPNELIYRGVDLINTSYSQLMERLRSHGGGYSETDSGLVMEEGKISLYIPAIGEEDDPAIEAVYVDMRADSE